ncbi:EI24 domain-containing protein [Croceibacterium sp. TMG7-5b_MA50]|uniref:EI24 domain-containing protein n=1 Tax=Croceibacterium sp. TMG7-5b_MA50 TaxID=3121290 RepID=UPI0032220088
MHHVARSLLLALRQLAERQVLAILLRSLLVSLALYAVLAGAGWWGLDRLFAWAGLEDALFAGAGPLRGLLSVLLVVTGLWLGWRIVAMAVIAFFADEVVAVVERQYYPAAAARAREPSLPVQARVALAGAGRALLVNLLVLPLAIALLVTGVGTLALFLLVNAVLLGRELQDMVWLRHRVGTGAPAPFTRAERFLLGGAIAVLLALPGIAFIAPLLGAAAATHLLHRKPEP